MEITPQINLLLRAVEHKFGQSIATTSHFNQLSLQITQQLHESLSVSTLKRIFGYVNSVGQPSHNTLCTLARYCGYTDWDSFQEKNPYISPAERRKRMCYQQLKQILDSRMVYAIWFKDNPKYSSTVCPAPGVRIIKEIVCPVITYSDALASRYIIRKASGNYTPFYDNNSDEILAQYLTLEELVEDGWELD